jgi:hypothetical protein
MMASRASEAKKPVSDRTHESKTRPCLMCGTRFTSSHYGERVCSNCKTTAAWREGAGAA